MLRFRAAWQPTDDFSVGFGGLLYVVTEIDKLLVGRAGDIARLTADRTSGSVLWIDAPSVHPFRMLATSIARFGWFFPAEADTSVGKLQTRCTLAIALAVTRSCLYIAKFRSVILSSSTF